MDENPKEVVKKEEVTTPPGSEPEQTQPQTPAVPEEPAGQHATLPKPGDKTDPNLLLKSLQDEREKVGTLESRIQELEGELEQAQSSALSGGEYSEEGKALKDEIASLRTELSGVKGELAKKDLLVAYPVLKDMWNELEEFRSQPDNKGMNLRTAAKAFLTENGLLEPTRKGLEKSTGGDRTPPSSGMTAEDVATLRKTNFKEYQRRLLRGEIKIAK